jgi:fluoroquinolone transport system ATP-binding protein
MPPANAPSIVARSLRFSYPGASRPAVQDVAFHVQRGEVFGFLGPSGAGKSTTQNILIGLLDGYLGAVEVLGREPRNWGRELYRRIGVAFESPNHYLRLSARENLALFAGLYGGRTQAPDVLLERVGLAEDAGRHVAEFSKGMRGRLTLARALLHRPELLFLDEPTAGLDPIGAAAFDALTLSLQRTLGLTVFLITHDLDTLYAICDRVAVLADRRVIAVGTIPELLALDHPWIQEYFNGPRGRAATASARQPAPAGRVRS